MTRESASELAWRLLERSRGAQEDLFVRESDIATPAGPVLHGLGGTGQRHLLVPVGGESQVLEDRESAGVQMIRRVLLEDDKQHSFVDVVCLLPHLEPLFTTLADEMLEEVSRCDTNPAVVCHGVLQRWRELLERPRTRLLSVDALIGLLGELVWLEALAREAPGSALEAWTGPTGNRFDFVGRNHALEVKASLAREGRSVEIHGVCQLEPPERGELHLFFVRYESASNGADGAQSVPSVIDSLIRLGVSRSDLLNRLANIGYDVADTSTYENFTFREVEALLYKVDDTFPKIVPASFITGEVPERVSSLRYTVDLAGSPPFPLDNSGLLGVVRSFVSTEP